jgi:hypothetical protein
MFLGLPVLQMVILPWSSAGLLLLPSSCCFVVIFLFITVYCTHFYLFVLWCSFPVSFLYLFVPVLYSTIESWCLLAMHMVFWLWNSTGLQLSPYFVVLDYLFINQILHFLPYSSSHFVHFSVLICLAVTPVRISFIMERLSSKLHWHHTTETFHQPLSFLHKLRFGTTGFLLDSWPLNMGPIGCPETSVRNYHYSLRNNP